MARLDCFRFLPFEYQLDCRDELGENLDLTGYTFLAKIRKSTATGTPVLATFTASVVVGEPGQILLTLTAAQTAALPLGALGWDLIVQPPAPAVPYLICAGCSLLVQNTYTPPA